MRHPPTVMSYFYRERSCISRNASDKSRRIKTLCVPWPRPVVVCDVRGPCIESRLGRCVHHDSHRHHAASHSFQPLYLATKNVDDTLSSPDKIASVAHERGETVAYTALGSSVAR